MPYNKINWELFYYLSNEHNKGFTEGEEYMGNIA